MRLSKVLLQAATSLFPLLVLGVHVQCFGDWIVDDAAISFAYAKNLAAGHGLVAQPGSVPVEGYSNPLWVLLLSPFFWAGLFHHVWTPKLLSVVLVGTALVVLQSAIRRFTPFKVVVPVLAASLLAAQTGIVAWTVSGLENGLYFFLLTLLLMLCLAPREGQARNSVAPGLVAAALSLTRPEGVLFLVAYPGCILGQRLGKRSWRPLLAYGVAAGVPLVAYLTFRLAYFGEWLPNTYLAKGGPRLGWVLELFLLQPGPLARLTEITESVVGWALVAWVPLLIAYVLFSESDRTYRKPIAVAAFLLVLGAAAFVLLPPDWMPGFRFGTPFYLFFIVALSMAVIRLVERLAPKHHQPVAVLVACTAVAISLGAARARVAKFVENAPMPVSETLETIHRFEQAAALIGDDQPSLLFADIGGPLLFSSIRIIDLGMLCDRRIAEYLGKGSNRQDLAAFHDYVLAEIRPTFIATRAYHSWIANLDSDLRFRRDYVPIGEYEDEWIQRRYGERRLSGDYVRRDQVTEQELAEMRDACLRLHPRCP